MALSFCANLHFLYTEFPFLERFREAAADGFRAIEMTFPYEFPAEAVRDACAASSLEVISLNSPPGEMIPRIRRGIAVIPGMEEAYRSQIRHGLRYAKIVSSPHLLSLAGFVPNGLSRRDARFTFIKNLRFAADECAEAGVTLLIETNNAVEHPGYFLMRLDQAADIIAAVNNPRLRLLFDTFHVGLNESDVIGRFKQYRSLIDHVQIANLPDRHEPGEGDLDFDAIFAAIEQSDYAAWVACEYIPKAGTRASLRWMKALSRK
jgi:hydroxypyruvate isomerase